MIRSVSLLATIIFMVSCSGSTTSVEGRKPVHPVRGQVLVSGKPAVGAFVLFLPKNESAKPTEPRPRGTVEEDGSFQLSTYGENDGAPAGDYFVAITWGVDGRDDEDRFGGRYSAKAPNKPTATVKEGPNELPPFKLR